MAISPTVQNHQMKMMQQEDVSPEQQTFNKKFGQSAFQALKAKYPKLTELVITFKVIDSDLEKSNGIGAFIISRGQGVLYVPIVLSEGTVTSCEMVYDKEEDTFQPLIEAIIKSIVSSNFVGEPTVVKKKPYTENTQPLIQNMFRPPSSSNPVLAGDNDGISSLPNSAKEKIATYLQEHPDTLAKIAQFYPLQKLAEKLKETPEEKFLEVDCPSVISIDQLTKEAAKFLSAEQRQEVLDKGYTVKNAATISTTPEVYSIKRLPVDITIQLQVVEKDRGQELYGKGYLMYLKDMDIASEKCVVAGDYIFTENGKVDKSRAVIAWFEEGVQASDLASIGAEFMSDYSSHDGSLAIFYPLKSGNFKSTIIYGYSGDVQRIEDDLYIGDYGFINSFSHGCFDKLYPFNSMFKENQRDEMPYIETITQLYKLMTQTGVTLRVLNNGAGLTLINNLEKTSHDFAKEAELVKFVVDNYNFSKQAAQLLLDEKELLVKKAFTQPAQVEPGMQAQQPTQAMFSEQPVEVEPEIIEDAAELGDPEMVDTGLLASVADNEDIKTVLVDMLPNFISTTTNLGRTILMLNLDMEEFKDYYGREQYNNLLSTVRKVFKNLGSVTADLRKYINMN